jgi:formylglycine-generating enzyme required for sulfatase activity
MRGTLSTIALVSLVLLAGCGGGKGKGGSQLVATVGQTRAFYQVLDLASGSVTAVGSISDIATNPAYKTTKMAFRLVATGNATLGGSGGVGGLTGDSDEIAHAASVHHFYLSMYETTQAQWTALGGSPLWSGMGSKVNVAGAEVNSAADIAIGASYPAIGIYDQDTATTLAAYNGSKSFVLRLPTEDEWEYACRAGSSGSFSWGNSLAPATVTANALVWETANDARGAAIVGSYAPNAWGFYDMHGNVWELCSGGHARGGSWNDSISAARCSNRAVTEISGTALSEGFPSNTSHLLMGVRLVYVP